jgi:hypothetical protein
MFYMQENPKGAKHSGYRGEAIAFPPGELVLTVQDELDEYDNDDAHALASEIASIAGLFQGDGEMPESVANTLALLAEHPSSTLLKLLQCGDDRARQAVIRMLSLPSLNSLPLEQFLDVEGWMHEHPEDAWKWAMALENIDVEFPWTEDEFTDEEMEQLAEIWNDVAELPKPDFVAKYASDADEAWMEMHGRIPKIAALRDIPPETVAAISLKHLMGAINSKELSDIEKDVAAPGAVGLVNVFGPRWRDWLKAMKRQKVGAHDAIYWLPAVASPGLDEFLFANKNRPLKDLIVVASAWNEIPRDIIDRGIQEATAFVRSRTFEGAKEPDLARYGAMFGYTEAQYEDIESRWIKLLKDHDNIPDIEVIHDGFVMHKLDPDDPRGIFLGKFTTCCQSPYDFGSASAWYGHSHPDSAFYVFETEDGRILAQSWVWRTDDAIVFDNWEGKGIVSRKYRDTLLAMFEQVARIMIEEHDIDYVVTGSTYDQDQNEIELPYPHMRDENGAPRPITFPPDMMFSTAYTGGKSMNSDAHGWQYLIAQSEDAPPYFTPSPSIVQQITTALKTWVDSWLTADFIDETGFNWDTFRQLLSNILESGVQMSYHPTGEKKVSFNDDKTVSTLCEIGFFIEDELIFTFYEEYVGEFVKTDEPYRVKWSSRFVGYDTDEAGAIADELIRLFYKGKKHYDESGGYWYLEHSVSFDDKPPQCGEVAVPNPFFSPPIELKIHPDDAKFALLIVGANYIIVETENNEELTENSLAFFYKTEDQLARAIKAYNALQDPLDRNFDLVLVRGPGISISEAYGVGLPDYLDEFSPDWNEDLELTEKYFDKVPD